MVNEAVRTSLSYLVVWVPLVGGVVVATTWRGQRSLMKDFGLEIVWVDVAWGVAAALVLRSLVPVLEFVAFGTVLAHESTLLTGLSLVDAIALLIAAVLIAPLVEELYFRGLLLRAVLRSRSLARAFKVPPSSAFMAFVAGCVSASFFAAMHLIGETSLSRAFVTGGSALLVGVVVSIFALKTQRLGPGLVTHALFNLLIVLPAMAWWS